MIRFVLRAAVAAFGLWLAARSVPGIRFETTVALVLAAVLLGVVNAVVRPVLVFLTLPVTILTLGLFLLVVNAAMFGLVALLIPGFHVGGFIPALLGALIVSLTGWVAACCIIPGK